MVKRKNRGQPFFWLLVGFAAGIALDRLLQRFIDPPAVLAPGVPAGPEMRSMAQGVSAARESPPDSVPGDGSPVAPDGYPVKGNERSGIYHVPGGFAYDRTVATVHFRSEEAAERAGLRHAKV